MERKQILIIIAVFVVVGMLFHTALLTEYNSGAYGTFRNLVPISIAIGIAGYAIWKATEVKSERFWHYLILANIFLAIIVAHTLKLMIGGDLICLVNAT